MAQGKAENRRGVAQSAVDVIVEGDCRESLDSFAEDFFSACVTDPPYNYEFIGRDWNEEEIERRMSRVKDSRTLVKNIPYGSGRAGGVRNKKWYENNRNNIIEYQNWCQSWGAAAYRTMRPGAYMLVFNSTRTIAHVQVALENAGFYARDTLVYRRQSGIPKGLNLGQKLKASGDPDWSIWQGWHSCLRNEWEAICVLQKPLIGNYSKTVARTGVGLMWAQRGEGNGFLSNVIEGITKSSCDPKDVHCTVKPLALMRFLVELVVPPVPGHVVLDPFCGTGTTCVAAKELGNSYVGMETSSTYCEYARRRLAGVATTSPSQENASCEQASLFAS